MSHDELGEVTFLLGAGFSRSVSDAMPLMSDLVRPGLPEWASNLDSLDVEAAFTLLHEPQPWRSEHYELEAAATAVRWSSAIADQIAKDQRAAAETSGWIDAFGRGEEFGWAARWVQWCESVGAAAITFNYDVIVERLCLRTAVPVSERVWDPSMTFPWGCTRSRSLFREAQRSTGSWSGGTDSNCSNCMVRSTGSKMPCRPMT